jgi:hypothetical protein
VLVLGGDDVPQVATGLHLRRIDPRLLGRVDQIVEHRRDVALTRGCRSIRVRVEEDRVIRPGLAPKLLPERLQLPLQGSPEFTSSKRRVVPPQGHRSVFGDTPLHEPWITSTLDHQPRVLLTPNLLVRQSPLARLDLGRALPTPRTAVLAHNLASARSPRRWSQPVSTFFVVLPAEILPCRCIPGGRVCTFESCRGETPGRPASIARRWTPMLMSQHTSISGALCKS